MSDLTLPAGLEMLVGPYLERQDWYHDALGSVSPSAEVMIESAEVLAGAWGSGSVGAGLARLVVTAASQPFQLVVGWRGPDAAAEALGGSDFAIIGSVRGDGGDVIAYDALADEELLLTLLEAATGGSATASRARLVESLTSHASIIFDDSLFMKLYRVLVPSPRREVEVMMRLDEAGFNHIVAPVAVWTRGGYDLALVREFVSGGLEGRALAVTSLRDLLGAAAEPDSLPDVADASPEELAGRAGGDLAGESRRLGSMTGLMHIALAAAFGQTEGDADALGDSIAAAGDPQAGARVKAMHDIGKAIRIQGDYQLRRVMRTDAGWILVGFGDDPSPIARLDDSQPVLREGVAAEDVADMCHSFRQVAASVVADYGGEASDGVVIGFARALADAWVRRNIDAFVDGYLATPGIRDLLPRHPAAFDVLLQALEQVRAHRAASG